MNTNLLSFMRFRKIPRIPKLKKISLQRDIPISPEAFLLATSGNPSSYDTPEGQKFGDGITGQREKMKTKTTKKIL